MPGTLTHENQKSATCLSVSGCKAADSVAEFGAPSTSTNLTCTISSKIHSFHGRKLPDHLISLESPEGQDLFHEACSIGHAANFFSLITNFASQSDVSMCGPASLAMVLNALGLDPGRTWKRPWRWWSDEMFACCDKSLEVMKEKGVTLEFFDRIAKSQVGIQVETRAPGDVDEFKTIIKDSVTTTGMHVIVSFGRGQLGQTGIGHFSPIAAYNPKKDLVLVLDVARFKYPPYWVKINELHGAIGGIDPITGISRGYSIIRKKNQNPLET